MDRRVAFALRVAGSLVMLAFLLPRVHLGSLFPTWHPSVAAWLALSLAFTGAGAVLATMRWSRVLEALEQHHAVRALFPIYLAGEFVSSFLPSTVGGDVLRVRRLTGSRTLHPAGRGLSRNDGDASVGRTIRNDGEVPFASVVLDRMTGWIVLPVLTLVALAWNPGLRRLGKASNLAVSVSAITLFGLSIVIAAAASRRIGGRLAGHESWLRFLGAVHLGLDRFRRHPIHTTSVLVAAFGYQLCIVATGWAGAHALGMSLSPTAALAFIPMVAIIQVVPISVGGFGVREGAFVLFLDPLGVPSGRAVALGILMYGMNLFVSLAGAPAFAVGGRTTGRQALA